jgi:hypothetical protein
VDRVTARRVTHLSVKIGVREACGRPPRYRAIPAGTGHTARHGPTATLWVRKVPERHVESRLNGVLSDQFRLGAATGPAPDLAIAGWGSKTSSPRSGLCREPGFVVSVSRGLDDGHAQGRGVCRLLAPLTLEMPCTALSAVARSAARRLIARGSA